MGLRDWLAAAVIVGGVVFLRRQIVALVRRATAWVQKRPPLGLLLWRVPLALLVLIVVVWLAWIVPIWQLADARPEALQPVASTKEYFDLVNSYRATIVQALAGVALLITIYLTWKRVTATEKQVAAAQEQVQVAREGQITERFTRAIDQLGSERLEIRLGGIYALERIARDSERDHWPIMEVLTAYVRKNAPRPEEAEDEEEKLPEPITTDIQAILTVIGRRRVEFDPTGQFLDLSLTNLSWADLSQANLSSASLYLASLMGADLSGADLSGAFMADGNLAEADLSGADLSGASMVDGNLAEADLSEAHLSETNLRLANLSKADLSRADLFQANLSGADLFQANLSGANLSEAKGLTREQIDSATIDEDTILPDDLEEEGEEPPQEPAGGESD